MSDRKSDLELKRQKLAELRRAREERKQQTNPSQQQSQQLQPMKEKSFTTNTLKEVDDLVASIVGTSTSSSPVPDSTAAASSNAAPNTSHVPKQLQISEMIIMDLVPKPRIHYNKEIQTSSDFVTTTAPTDEEHSVDTQLFRKQVEIELTEKIMAQLKPSISSVNAKPDSETIQASSPEVKILTEEQIQAAVSSEDFIHFFGKSSKLIEKALNEKIDFIRDYSLVSDQEEDLKNDLQSLITFSHDRWTSGRTVTDCCWSSKFGELCLASYDKASTISSNNGLNSDSDGLVLVWNLHLPDRPEFLFESPSSVCSAVFSPYHPNYLIGGTYSGQIMLWDTRSKSLPVLKSPSSSGHSHPVYSLKIVGTRNAHHLITCSSDGLMCSWQLDMLARPIDKFELTLPVARKSDELSITCMDFPDNEGSSFAIGTEEGLVLEGSRFDAAGGKAGIKTREYSSYHSGQVTSLSFHNSSGPLDFSSYFLTSSVDWTVKLWKRVAPKNATSSGGSLVPVSSFEIFTDYVYDAKWSTRHPSVFATADGSGALSLWNLNISLENPTASIVMEQGLNKLAWDKDGNKIAAGSSDGKLYIQKVSNDYLPKQEDYIQFQKILTEKGNSNTSSMNKEELSIFTA